MQSLESLYRELNVAYGHINILKHSVEKLEQRIEDQQKAFDHLLAYIYKKEDLWKEMDERLKTLEEIHAEELHSQDE